MPTSEPPPLKNVLRHFRLSAGLSQDELAERSGLSTRSISDIERGLRTSPHLETIRLLTIGLDLSETERSALITAARPELHGSQTHAEPRTSEQQRAFQSPLTHASHSLPIPPTGMIGRERELKDVLALIEIQGARLVTLTGPGGVGKTRLCLDVAKSVSASDGRSPVFVDLSRVTRSDNIVLAVLEAFGISNDSAMAPFERLTAVVRAEPYLLVLDNFEQVLTGVQIVSDLLGAVPGIAIIVTSRVRLNLRGEHVVLVEPLELPLDDSASAELLARNPAVRLFIERARESHHGFDFAADNAEPVASICRRLDGLPLAIELATSWLRVLTPQELRVRLHDRLPTLGGGARDAPARQQTLRDTIGWSLDLLTQPERELFRVLGVFIGGAHLDAIQMVLSSTSTGDASMLDSLSALVDKSLIRQTIDSAGDTRFTMLETIREFAVELLDSHDERNAVRSAHAAWIEVLAEQAEPFLVGPDEPHWRNRLTTEQPNIRSALSWCVESEDTETGLRIGGAIWRFWATRGRLLEGLNWLERLMALPEIASPAVRAKAIHSLGNLEHDLGDFEAAQAHFEAGLHIRREIGDQNLIANSLNGLGLVAFAQREFDLARKLHEESLAISQEANHLVGIGNSYSNLADVEKAVGDIERSRSLQEKALAVRQTIGDNDSIGFSLYNLGSIARENEEDDAALDLLESALALFRTAEDLYGAAFALTDLGLVHIARGNTALGTASLIEAFELRQEMGDRRGLIDCLEAVIPFAVEAGHHDQAMALAESASRHRETLNAPRSPLEQRDVDRWLEPAGDQKTDTTPSTRPSSHPGSLEAAVAFARSVLTEILRT